jgi:hypothetical protein
MAAQVESLVPTATQVLGVVVEQTSVPVQSGWLVLSTVGLTHSTQAPATTGSVVAALHLFRVAEMAAQVVSSEPMATQVLAFTVERTGVAADVAAVHDTQDDVPVSHLGMAAEMAAQVESLEPTTTQVFAAEQTSVPGQSISSTLTVI